MKHTRIGPARTSSGLHAIGWFWILAVTAFAATDAAPAPPTLSFAGRTWRVRGGQGGPGPNAWDPANLRVDAQGHLHLSLRKSGERWTCAEATLTERLGPGRYTFEVEGALDRLDDHVVLGLFNYPTGDVGPDATHEIDIEFARWGRPTNPIGNYTVWPVDTSLKPTSKTYELRQSGAVTTHQFDWNAKRVLYRSWSGAITNTAAPEIARWDFAPPDPERRISARPMPVHLNLWLFQGKPPKDGRELELVVRDFRFEPAPPAASKPGGTN